MLGSAESEEVRLISPEIIFVFQPSYRLGQKQPFLIDDNFAAVNGRKACDMSKVCKIKQESCAIAKMTAQCAL